MVIVQLMATVGLVAVGSFGLLIYSVEQNNKVLEKIATRIIGFSGIVIFLSLLGLIWL